MKRIRFTLVNTSLPYELTLNNQASIDNYSNVIQRGKQVFGSDLSMLGQGTLTIKTKDLDVVSGLLNFAQLIQHLLMTDRGTLPEDENFGIPWSNYIGKPYSNKQSLFNELSNVITSELSSQYGVKSVDNITVKFIDAFAIEISIEMTPISFFSPIKFSGTVQA